jgi:hypothetical protein
MLTTQTSWKERRGTASAAVEIAVIPSILASRQIHSAQIRHRLSPGNL